MSPVQLFAYTSPTSPADEEEFNDWYDHTHIPQVVERVPGVLAGRRARLSDVQAGPAPERRYLAIYDLDPADVAGTLERIGAALADGTLDPTPTLDAEDLPPVMVVYESVS